MGIFEGKSGHSQEEETDEQHKVLKSLVSVHAENRGRCSLAPGLNLASQEQQIVRAHESDGADDENDVDALHPPVPAACGVAGVIFVRMDAPLNEVIGGARMALAARLNEVAGVHA